MSYQVLNYQADGSTGFLEKEEWKTNIGTNRNGSEVRVSVRTSPRYRFEYTLPAYDERTRPLLETLRTHQGLWLIPLWPHITAGSNRPAFIGTDERMLSLMSDGSFIESVSAPVSGAVEVLPAALAGLVDAPRIKHTNDTLAEARVAFLLSGFRAQVPAWDGPSIDGKPVWTFNLDWGDGVEEEVRRDGERVDFDLAWAEHVRFLEKTHSGTVVLVGTEELSVWRKFRYAVRGQAGEFWMQGPGDTELMLYRLATDQIETAYRFGADEPWGTAKVAFKRLG